MYFWNAIFLKTPVFMINNKIYVYKINNWRNSWQYIIDAIENLVLLFQKIYKHLYMGISWQFVTILTAVFLKLVQCQPQLNPKIQPIVVEGARSNHT